MREALEYGDIDLHKHWSREKLLGRKLMENGVEKRRHNV
jgi:hypothetical protein